MRPLRLYSDRAWRLPGKEDAHVTALTPFWGHTSAPPHPGFRAYADRLIATGKEFLNLTSLAEADVAVFPTPGRPLLQHPEGRERAREFAQVAREARTPTAFFFDFGDSAHYSRTPFPVSDAFLFRGSIYRSRRGARDFALPGFHEDILERLGGAVPVRSKRAPVVSFCGFVIRDRSEPPSGLAARARRVAGNARRFAWRIRGRHEEDLFARERALATLAAQDAVETNIVLRDSGAGGNYPVFDQALWDVARKEYVGTMVESDYVLCVRGDGNWSIRLYETLCLGRIPVLIDTDIVLPYDFIIPWRDHVVWIDRSEIPRIGEKVAVFHESLGEDEFRDRQRANRQLWEQYLSPLGFFRNLHRHFEHAGVLAPAPAPSA
jgi:Exostosin family